MGGRPPVFGVRRTRTLFYRVILVVALLAAGRSWVTRAPSAGVPSGGSKRRGASTKGGSSALGTGTHDGDGRYPFAGHSVGSSPQPAGRACVPQLDRSVLQAAARAGVVTLAVASGEMLELLRNWVASVRLAGLDNILVGAVDAAAQEALPLLHVPCFTIDTADLASQGLGFGEEGWRRMTWQKVFVAQAAIEADLDIVVSDLDVAWLRDPRPLFALHPAADVLFSHDGTWTKQPPGSGSSEQLEEGGTVWDPVNAGLFLARSNERTKAFFREWAARYETSTVSDQFEVYQVLRQGSVEGTHPSDSAVHAALDGRLWVGLLPVYAFANGHSYAVSRLHELWGTGSPYAVHATWTYGGNAGKVSRFREAMLWRDDPAYHEQGNYLTVDLRLPDEAPPTGDVRDNEPQIQLHLRLLAAQLEQVYVGMAMAVASGRRFIMPKMLCYCESAWHAVVNCRLADAQDMRLPFVCPADYHFELRELGKPSNMSGVAALALREHSFLENAATSAAIKDSVLTLQFSPQKSAAACASCIAGGKGCGRKPQCAALHGSHTLQLAPHLMQQQLAHVLQPHVRRRLWRLNFDLLETPKAAFGGFKCQGVASHFDGVLQAALRPWCCRFKADAKRLKKKESEALTMTPGWTYASMEGLDRKC